MLATVFGQVAIERIAYRAKGADSRFVADAQAVVVGSFAHAQHHIASVTGVTVGKRQVEALALAAAADVDGFYASKPHAVCPDGDVLVLSADAKGIVMRPEALREPCGCRKPRPCSSGGMLVLMEHSAESITAVDVQMCELLRICDRFG
jgi:hypothetical protein